jgi:hemolysin activation/secretion protein
MSTDRLTRADEPLNILMLGERFQLLLTDPLFARMNGQLLPDAERGQAILNVEVERALPYQLSVFANNYLPISIGPQSGTIAGWVRNLTGYGDVLEASYQDPLGHGDARRGAIGWRMPLNTWGTQLSLYYDSGVSSVIQQPTRPLNIESDLTNKEIGLGQVLSETLRQRLAVGVNRVWRENRTTLLGDPFSFVPGEPTGTSKARDWRFWQEYSHRSDDQVLALRSTFTFGENNQLPRQSLPPSRPDARSSLLHLAGAGPVCPPSPRQRQPVDPAPECPGHARSTDSHGEDGGRRHQYRARLSRKPVGA